MDTQHRATALIPGLRDKGGFLAHRRTWHENDPDPSVTQTVPYAEFKKIQDQYNGLKGLSDSRLVDLNAANARITTLTTEYEGSASTLRTERDRAVTEAGVFKTQHETEKQRADRLAAENGLTKTILGKKEYAPLTDLLADGLLRVDGLNAEEQVAYLDKMAAKFGTGVAAAAGKVIQGTTPIQPDGTQGLTLTSEQMLDKMMTLDPGSAEYTTLSAAYVATLK